MQKLPLNLETTFFTNYYLGLRMDEGEKYAKATSTKRAVPLKKEYKDLCAEFFLTQLKVVDPKIVLCLGNEVGHALFQQSKKVFEKFSSKGGIMSKMTSELPNRFIVETDNSPFGKRKFILIPHPAYAHIYWKDPVQKRIVEALKS